MTKKILISFFLLLISQQVLVGQFLHRDKLIAYYPLDGNAKDMSGNYQNGIIMGGVTPTKDRKGKDGGAVRFNGKDGLIRIKDTQKMDLLTGQFSFSVWVSIKKWDKSVFWPQAGTDLVAPILCKSYLNQDFQYRWGCTDKGFYADGKVSTELPYVVQDKGILLNKWTFLSITVNNGTVKFYVDGKVVKELESTFRYEYNENNLVLGCDYPGAPYALDFFNGDMDDLRMYKKTLSDKEVYALYTENFTDNLVMKGAVFDRKTTAQIPAYLTLKSTNNGELKASSTETEGYSFTLKANEKVYVRIAVLGYLKYSDSILLDSIVEGTFTKNFYLLPGKVGQGTVLKNVLFVQSKAELLPASYGELNRLVAMMKDNPDLEIELGGHTEKLGDEKLNQQLSEQRVQVVKNYLISRGIAASRITGVGYGSSRAVMTETKEEDIKRNRRVEFKILRF